MTAAAAILAMTACQNTSQNQTNAAEEVKAEEETNAMEETEAAEELAAAGEDYRVHPEETAEQYALKESMIVRADWTEEREEPVNYGNGSHSRYYVCGKTESDPVWRIYEWGVM